MNELEASYAECKRLNSLHGKTYYLATLLLPKAKRKYVHALYGFARYADEIVDDLASTLTVQEKADALGVWGEKILRDLKLARVMMRSAGHSLIRSIPFQSHMSILKHSCIQ